VLLLPLSPAPRAARSPAAHPPPPPTHLHQRLRAIGAAELV